jgi:hypothetical protein
MFPTSERVATQTLRLSAKNRGVGFEKISVKPLAGHSHMDRAIEELMDVVGSRRSVHGSRW